MKQRYQAATVICPNQTCKDRECYTKCYLDTGMHQYQNCKDYKEYMFRNSRKSDRKSLDRKV